MKTIWKYPLLVDEETVLQIPRGARVLKIMVQEGRPMLWAMVDTEQPPVPRSFRTFGTGHPLPSKEIVDVFSPTHRFVVHDCLTYVDSYMLHEGALVFHVFEMGST